MIVPNQIKGLNEQLKSLKDKILIQEQYSTDINNLCDSHMRYFL